MLTRYIHQESNHQTFLVWLRARSGLLRPDDHNTLWQTDKTNRLYTSR